MQKIFEKVVVRDNSLAAKSAYPELQSEMSMTEDYETKQDKATKPKQQIPLENEKPNVCPPVWRNQLWKDIMVEDRDSLNGSYMQKLEGLYREPKDVKFDHDEREGMIKKLTMLYDGDTNWSDMEVVT